MPWAPVFRSMHQNIDHEAFAMDGARECILHQVVELRAFTAVRTGLAFGGHGGPGHARDGGNFAWASGRATERGVRIGVVFAMHVPFWDNVPSTSNSLAICCRSSEVRIQSTPRPSAR